MSAGAVRAAAAVFLLGMLVVWLVRPIGNPCPDAGALPSGSTRSSAPSFAPPFTRICTYMTPEGTQARRRYVPVLDLLVLIVVAGVMGGAVGLAGPGRGAARAQRPPRAPRAKPAAAPAASEETERERAAAERQRARDERARRRG